MPMTRILVVLSALPNEVSAAATVAEALRRAAGPDGLRFALPKRMERAFWDYFSQPLDHSRVCFYGERGGLRAAAEELRGERYFLSLMGEYRFAEKWEQTLLSRLAKTGRPGGLLTASMGEEAGKYPVQPYLPAVWNDFTPEGARIGPGLPIVCAAAPVPTWVIDPALLFGGADFLRQAELRRESLSLAAFVTETPVFALDRAAVWPKYRLPERRLRDPGPEALPRPKLTRFEQLAGFSFERELTEVRAAWGLPMAASGYAQQLPPLYQARRRLKALALGKKPALLAATAFIDWPAPEKPLPAYLLRFGFLKALENLPLYLYTGGSQERRLRAEYPNAHSYPDNALLPKALLQKGMTVEQWTRRNKIPLLEKLSTQQPGFSHLAWVNMDALRHPVCPKAVPDFSPLLDDRVHLATVDGAPDASFLVIPAVHIRALRRQVEAITQLDGEMKRGFSEEELFARLYQWRPDLFTLHPMPKKHLLFLTGFDPALLDARYQTLLKKETKA